MGLRFLYLEEESGSRTFYYTGGEILQGRHIYSSPMQHFYDSFGSNDPLEYAYAPTSRRSFRCMRDAGRGVTCTRFWNAERATSAYPPYSTRSTPDNLSEPTSSLPSYPPRNKFERFMVTSMTNRSENIFRLQADVSQLSTRFKEPRVRPTEFSSTWTFLTLTS